MKGNGGTSIGAAIEHSLRRTLVRSIRLLSLAAATCIELSSKKMLFRQL